MQGVHAAILKSDLSDFQTLAKNDDAAARSTPVKMDLAESTLKVCQYVIWFTVLLLVTLFRAGVGCSRSQSGSSIHDSGRVVEIRPQ